MKLRIVFPCMAFEPNKIDPEYAEEHAAVRLLGGVGVLFDFDLFRSGDKEAAFKNVPILHEPQEWTYRGWMMSPEEYQEFFNEMKKRGYVLSNNPNVYSICHLYPLIYPYIKERAIKTFVVDGDEVDHDALVEFFGKKRKNRKLFVKDWVKSAKGTPDATVINDYLDKDEVMRVTANMIEAQGDRFYGGIVFKEFVDIIKRPSGLQDEEYRGFFIKDKLVTWMPANGTGGQDFDPPEWANELASNIPGDFYTLDFVFVEGDNGPEAVILEAGDGGVSMLSDGQMPITLYSAMEEYELISE